jgi:aerobic-type carbon monoxide dehydrogenase small subunit (CoxS/CutS family)
VRRKLSRRDLLKGGAAAGALGTLGLLDAEAGPKKGRKRRPKKGKGAGGKKPAAPAESQAPPLPEICGPGPVAIRLRVNGDFQQLAVAPHTTLLEVLRDRLGLHGTKEVCDRGSCGACTVLLDDKPVHACGILAVSAHRRQLQSVEGLSRTRGKAEVHPLAASFAAAGALRCGFCTPGVLMAAKALLDRNPSPAEADVDQALCGNLCRCGCYPAIRSAVLEAAPQLAGEGSAEDGEFGDGAEGSELLPEPPEPPEASEEPAALPSRRSLLIGRRRG